MYIIDVLYLKVVHANVKKCEQKKIVPNKKGGRNGVVTCGYISIPRLHCPMNYNTLITPNGDMHIRSSMLLLLTASDICNCKDVRT